MICSSNQLQITTKYKVIAVHSNVVTTELSAPPAPNATIDIQVLDDSPVVTNNFLFGGNWKRKR